MHHLFDRVEGSNPACGALPLQSCPLESSSCSANTAVGQTIAVVNLFLITITIPNIAQAWSNVILRTETVGGWERKDLNITDTLIGLST